MKFENIAAELEKQVCIRNVMFSYMI